MPHFRLEVPETYDSMTRPIVHGVTSDLIKKFDLPNDTTIRIQGDALQSNQRSTTLGNENQTLSTPYTNRLDVDFEENYLDSETLKHQFSREIFTDTALGVYLRPFYTRVRVELSFVLRSENKTVGLKTRDHIKRKMSEGVQALLHEIYYHYSTPTAMLSLLNVIWHHRETVAGYNESYDDYVINHSHPNLTTLSNLSGERLLNAVAEKQIEVEGWFNFESHPEKPEREADGGTYSTTFTYTFEYDKVISMQMEYPIVVHNQLLDEKYVQSPVVYNSATQHRGGSHLTRVLDNFRTTQMSLISRGFNGVVIPPYDTFKPINQTYKTFDILTTLVGVDPEDPTLILNLEEIEEFSFDPAIVTFLKKHHDKLQHYLANAFHITFYKGLFCQSVQTFTVDESLTIRTKEPMNLRDVHHLKVSMIEDPRRMAKKAIDDLLKTPKVATLVVDLLEQNYKPINAVNLRNVDVTPTKPSRSLFRNIPYTFRYSKPRLEDPYKPSRETSSLVGDLMGTESKKASKEQTGGQETDHEGWWVDAEDNEWYFYGDGSGWLYPKDKDFHVFMTNENEQWVYASEDTPPFVFKDRGVFVFIHSEGVFEYRHNESLKVTLNDGSEWHYNLNGVIVFKDTNQTEWHYEGDTTVFVYADGTREETTSKGPLDQYIEEKGPIELLPDIDIDDVILHQDKINVIANDSGVYHPQPPVEKRNKLSDQLTVLAKRFVTENSFNECVKRTRPGNPYGNPKGMMTVMRTGILTKTLSY